MEKMCNIPQSNQVFEEPYSGSFESIVANDIDVGPSELLLNNYIKERGFGQFNIDVYDNWIYNTAEEDIRNTIPINLDNGNIITLENLRIDHPNYIRDGETYPMTPQNARLNLLTYGSNWYVDVILKNTEGDVLDKAESICIGNIPMMLKSKKCILHGKTPHQLEILGEDPNDPGGYFIVKGVEKVVLLQEQLALNRILMMDMGNTKKRKNVVRLVANTTHGTSLIQLILDKRTNSIIKVQLPSLRSKEKSSRSINVLYIFALYPEYTIDVIESLILSFVRPEWQARCSLKLIENINDFKLKSDVSKVWKKKFSSKDGSAVRRTDNEVYEEIMKIMKRDMFPHMETLPVINGQSVEQRSIYIRNSKLNLLAIMTARFLEHLAGYRHLDDRDSWSNKRVEGGGRMMEQSFRGALKNTITSNMKDTKSTHKVRDFKDVVNFLKKNDITDTFQTSFTGTLWGAKNTTKPKKNVTQTLERQSMIATYAHINTVDVGVSRTDRQPSLRLVQNSSWGFICPVSTPEGKNAGIVKNLTITAQVTIDRSDDIIIRRLWGDDENIPPLVFDEPELNLDTKVMVNAKYIGWCNGQETYAKLVEWRRSCDIYYDTTLILDEDWLYIDQSPSRLVRPLLVVNDQQELVIDVKNKRDATISELIASGCLEYLSPWEQEQAHIKIAVNEQRLIERLARIKDGKETYRLAQQDLDDVIAGKPITVMVEQRLNNEIVSKEEVLTQEGAERRLSDARTAYEKAIAKKPYSHCEIDDTVILSIAAALIPWANHNQAPRNTYQVSMGKQALGIYHTNYKNRYDMTFKAKTLAYPQRPMVENKLYQTMGLDFRGPGQNVAMAFIAYPFTEEDSFIIKKEFLDNQGMRIYKFFTYKTILHNSGNLTENLTKPKLKPEEQQKEYLYRYINPITTDGGPTPGLPMLGAPLKEEDYVIGKMQYDNTNKNDRKERNESVRIHAGDEGIVDKVLVTRTSSVTMVIVKLRVMRVPQEGDKFAPRNAQKGTCGLVVSDINLPANEHGVVPDFIVNPASIPSRMTMEYLMEIIASKYGAMVGKHINGGSFRPFELDVYRKKLLSYNINEFGYETMTSGLRGKPLLNKKSQLYMGPVFFQSLKHHVKDKIQARATGVVKPDTRQPVGGRSHHGGLRFGSTLEPMWCVKTLQVPVVGGQRIQTQGNSQMIYKIKIYKLRIFYYQIGRETALMASGKTRR